jgi:preprotein translocase SecE subunit
MNKVQQAWASTRGFFGEVVAELKKCAWPTGRELVESTGVIIVAVLMLAVYVGLCDITMITLLNKLIGR